MADVGTAPAIAVALHDVEPSTFERCALIRDWLADQGIDRATLLVVPAPDLHHVGDSSPELVAWLDERRERGDAIAQHGLQHGRGGGAGGAEFAHLGERDARRAVDAGWRALRLAGVAPKGFVAPGYAYTPALHAVLGARFDWWAGFGRLWRRGEDDLRVPAIRATAPAGARRVLAPWTLRAATRPSRPLLRVDVHPADLDGPRAVEATEALLRRARGRVAVTYDQLLR